VKNFKTIANTIRKGYSEGKGWQLLIEINVWENLSDNDLEEIANQIENGEPSSYFNPCNWTLVTQ
jgi:ubiquinone biosynthesis protein Coq4